MNYCSNCGTKLDANASFCHNCGARVAASNTGYTTNTVINGQKSKFVAGIVAILLGTLGIHNFYLGYYKKGITQLLLFVFFLGWASQIWAIYEALMILTGRVATDANGMPLSD